MSKVGWLRASVLTLTLALAGVSNAAHADDAPQINAQYRVFVHGLHVADADAGYKLTPWGYGLSTHLSAGGFISLLLSMDVNSHADGRFASGWVDPVQFESGGKSRGKQRHVVVDYHGADPVVTTLTPKEDNRETVPDAEKQHAIDTLSAMALLLNTLEKTGKCDGQSKVFDGLRLTTMKVSGPIAATVPNTGSEVFKGQAQRCDFVGQQIAGFIKGSSHLEEMKAPHAGSAWFQPMPGLGLVAVRIEFDHPKLGHIVAVLSRTPQKT